MYIYIYVHAPTSHTPLINTEGQSGREALAATTTHTDVPYLRSGYSGHMVESENLLVWLGVEYDGTGRGNVEELRGVQV